ncbi:MAG: ATPase [Ruminococcus sp.]|nr:ATPase [Ruminococcus sp.]
MAVSNMQAVNIIGLMNDVDDVITALGESGVFHPDDVSNFYSDIKNFTHLQTKNIYAEPLTNLKASLGLAKREIPLTDVSEFNPTLEEIETFVKKTVKAIDELADEREFIAEQLLETKDNLNETSHFVGLGVEIEKLLHLSYLSTRFGRLPKESFQKLSAYQDNEYVDFTICTEDKSHYWGVYFAPIGKEFEIDRIFSGLYFEKCDVMGVNNTPREHLEKLNKLIPLLEGKLSEATKNLNNYIDSNLNEIQKYLSKLEELYLYAKIRNKALQYQDSFIIVGWVPEESTKPLKKQLKKINSVTMSLSDGKNEIKKSPPVKLKNCFLAKPFEFYTEMYGVPKYNEIDPSMFIALTYTIIFGIMFADLGQGICVSIVGYLMWKLKKMKIGKVLIPCGIFSAIFGLVFGSVFGFEEALNPLYKALFGLEEKPINVMQSDSIIVILLTAVGIGVALVITAMCLNVYSSFKQGDVGKALFGSSGIAGIIFYGSIVTALICQLGFGIKMFTLPYILGLMVLPYLLIFFGEPLGLLIQGEKDWQPEKWGGYIMEHAIESIEFLLEYVTNTVSFLRVGAFVLVHAGMMMVVFVLAGNPDSFMYIPVVILGNVFVMVLEALLVAIQALRLEYYEMFSRFYAGEGRPYEPVKLNIN